MKNSGFTLIEVMIVVAIIGIISAIAYPSYNRYIIKSKRTECRGAIMEALQQQERYYTQQNTYLAYSSSAANIAMKQFSGETAAKSACLISAAACGNISACVTVTGTPNDYIDPEVGSINMQSSGTRGCSGSNQTKCWTN